jgi:hypothetical protein
MSQFEPISGKKLGVLSQSRFFKQRHFFFEIEESVFKTFYKESIFNRLESIQKIFFMF